MLGIERRAIRDKTKIYTIETSVFQDVINGRNRSKLIKRLSNIKTFKKEVKKNGGEKQFLESQEAQDIFKVLLRGNSDTSLKALSNFGKTIATLSFRHFAETGNVGYVMKKYREIEKADDNIFSTTILHETSFLTSLRDYKEIYIAKNKNPDATDKHIELLSQPMGSKPNGLIRQEDYRELNDSYELYENRFYLYKTVIEF